MAEPTSCCVEPGGYCARVDTLFNLAGVQCLRSGRDRSSKVPVGLGCGGIGCGRNRLPDITPSDTTRATHPPRTPGPLIDELEVFTAFGAEGQRYSSGGWPVDCQEPRCCEPCC